MRAANRTEKQAVMLGARIFSVLCVLLFVAVVGALPSPAARAEDEGIFTQPQKTSAHPEDNPPVAPVTADNKNSDENVFIAPLKTSAQPDDQHPANTSGKDAAKQPDSTTPQTGAISGEHEKMVPVADMLNPPIPDEEKPSNELIVNAVTGKSAGAVSVVSGKKPMQLTMRQAAIDALERTITLQIFAHDTEIARYALREAKAVFLPVFTVNTNVDSVDTFERKRELTVFEKLALRASLKQQHDAAVPGEPPPPPVLVSELKFLQQTNLVFADPKNPNNFIIVPKGFTGTGSAGTVLIDQNGNVVAQFNGNPNSKPDQAAFVKQVQQVLQGKQIAAFDPPFFNTPVILPQWNVDEAFRAQSEDKTVTMNASIFQQLPWGPQLALTYTPVYHNKAYDRFGNTFEHPYYTSLTADLFVPLPFTANFGPYAPQEVGVKLAKLDKKRALADFKTAINNTLVNVDLAYLDLVTQVKNVESTVQNRKSMEATVAQTGQLLDNGRTTAFGKDQVDGELLRVRVAEEQAWNSYLASSNALVNLLNLPADTVLVPVGYSPVLNQHRDYNVEEALGLAMRTRPELESDSYKVSEQRIRVKFREQQTRPNLNFNGALTLAQAVQEDAPPQPGHNAFRGTPLGFRDPIDSLRNITDPDIRTDSYTLTYQRSMFLRGEKARVEEARGLLDQQKLNTRIDEDAIANQVNDALATLDTAKIRLENAQISLDAAKKAYDLALDSQKLGRVTEFELISKSQDWLNSQLSFIDAQINYKRAESLLLHAEGTLPMEYPEMTSPNEFDRYRLGLLRASNALHFFGKNDKDAKDDMAPEKKAP